MFETLRGVARELVDRARDLKQMIAELREDSMSERDKRRVEKKVQKRDLSPTQIALLDAQRQVKHLEAKVTLLSGIVGVMLGGTGKSRAEIAMEALAIAPKVKLGMTSAQEVETAIVDGEVVARPSTDPGAPRRAPRVVVELDLPASPTVEG